MLTQTIVNPVEISPARIMETGLGFWSSKILLTAVNLELFTVLSDTTKTAVEIQHVLKLHNRSVYDFLDSLVALKFLHKEGTGLQARYGNTLETNTFLDKKKLSYSGGLLEMANNRLYPFWNSLEEALKTGLPQNEVKSSSESTFETLYSDENRLEEFLSAMGGVQAGNFISFAKQFDFSDYYTHCDIGGAGGDLAIQVAIHNPNIHSTSFDLPQTVPIAQRNVNKHKINDRVTIAAGNFFTDQFPKADIITMGNILHDWNLEEKKMLIAKAYDALPSGGTLVAIENVIDDERKENAFGLMMSLNMLIETFGGFDYTASDFKGWAAEAGFSKVSLMRLTGPSSAMIAVK